MKNNLLLYFLLLFVFASSLSQAKAQKLANLDPRTFLDNSKMEVRYNHTVYDTILKQTKQFEYILQDGDKYSSYRGYQRYQADSAVYSISDVSKLTVNEYFKITENYIYSKSTPLVIIKNKKDKIISFVDRIPLDNYTYEEDFPVLDWTLLDDTLTVCEHLCHKATTLFRGREWTAWYSEDIPEDNGPWKFGGLPGLILKVEDRDKEHVFEAIMIRNSNMAIRRDKGDSFFNTSRKQMIKQMNEYHEDSGKYTGSKIKSINGKPQVQEKPQRKFYNQIERE